MIPRSKIASDITVAVPVDIALFRISAYADESEYPDEGGLFTSRVERAVEVVESMTRLSLKRATYTCEWDALPEAPRADRDRPLTFPGFWAGDVTEVSKIAQDGTATPIDASLWTALPATEIGSVEIVPSDGSGRWRTVDPEIASYSYSGYGGYRTTGEDAPRGYRVVGTAGCDLTAGQSMPGPFFEGLAHVFRYLWMTEPGEMEAAKRIMGKWILAGGKV